MTKMRVAKVIIGNIKLTNLFKSAYSNYVEIQKELEQEFANYDFKDKIIVEKYGLNFAKGFKKNFFTLLMLSILANNGISKKRIIEYGKIILCLRIIITCTDNIIDNEKKGVVFLESIKNSVVSNTMLLMTAQNILSRCLRNLGDENNETLVYILNKIHNVAESEGLRDRVEYTKYPSVKTLVNDIHGGIGGELLQLSLLAPEKLESQHAKLDKYNEGLYCIGMALQALDDLCDMQEDMESSKVNLGIAELINSYGVQEEDIPELIQGIESDKKYNEFYTKYLDNCIDTALKGFDIFIEQSYPINRKDALELLKILFELRGLNDMWKRSSYL